MRVCIINEFFYPDNTGGTGTVLSSLVGSLRADYEEVQIDVITSNNLYRKSGEPLAAQEDWNGVHIHRLATPRPNGLPMVVRLAANFLFCFAALAKLLRLGRFDLLLVGTAPPVVAMIACLYKSLTRTPFLYIVYDLEPDRSVVMHVLGQGHPVARLFRFYQKRWLHAAAKVVVLGRCMQDYLRRAYVLDPNRIDVIPIGGDHEEIMPLDKQTRFRATHGLSGFLAVYSGNFGRYHNFGTILDAAKRLQAGNADITIVLVGDGAQKEHIKQRIAQENIRNVRLLDFVSKEDYPDLLSSADVSLVTLEPGMEGLCVPSKFYSILASGRPTVAMVSSASEIARVIDEAGCGIHIAQSDTAMLEATLLRLAENPEETKQMGQNARRVLVAEYGMNTIAQRYHAAFLDVVAGRPGKPGPDERSAVAGQAERAV